jgi:hypothetical protein
VLRHTLDPVRASLEFSHRAISSALPFLLERASDRLHRGRLALRPLALPLTLFDYVCEHHEIFRCKAPQRQTLNGVVWVGIAHPIHRPFQPFNSLPHVRHSESLSPIRRGTPQSAHLCEDITCPNQPVAGNQPIGIAVGGKTSKAATISVQ